MIMETTLDFYKQCVKALLRKYEKFQDEESKIELIFDDDRMRYLALWVGWNGYRWVHQCAVHIDIMDDRIAIECNDTEDEIVPELVEMGIPHEIIDLNFIHPLHKTYNPPETWEAIA